MTSKNTESAKNAARPLYVVLHVHKTAGTTLRLNFERNFGNALLPLYWLEPPGKSVFATAPEYEAASAPQRAQAVRQHVARHVSQRTSCLYGHAATVDTHVVVEEAVGAVEARTITFLREPVERCLSRYHWLASLSQLPEGRRVRQNNWSLDEWIDKDLEAEAEACNGQLRLLLRSTRDGSDLPRELTRQHLEEGKERLRRFWFVGLTETFGDDSHFLYGRLNFRRLHWAPVVNATPVKKEASPATRHRLAQLNALDTELYEFARALRLDFVRRPTSHYERHKNKALRRRRLTNVAWRLRSALRALIK